VTIKEKGCIYLHPFFYNSTSEVPIPELFLSIKNRLEVSLFYDINQIDLNYPILHNINYRQIYSYSRLFRNLRLAQLIDIISDMSRQDHIGNEIMSKQISSPISVRFYVKGNSFAGYWVLVAGYWLLVRL
jgi:hypothetical protein